MTKVIDWRAAEDPRDVIHLAVQALAEGHLVAFPCEAHYVVTASSLRPDAIAQLALEETRPALASSPPVSLLPRSADEVLDFVPNVSSVGMRLANRLWPGPVQILLKEDHPSALPSQLAPSVQAAIHDQRGYLSLTMPRHESLKHVVRLSVGPLAVVNLSSSLDITQLPTSVEQIDRRVALAIDDGVTRAPGHATVVRIDGAECRVEHQGKLSAEDLVSMSQFQILLVCTGNTCRSPMAEALLKKKLKEKFPDRFSNSQLPPIAVSSAGISALPGGSASDGAIAAMSRFGLRLDAHESRQTTQNLVDRADLILTMTQNHRYALLNRWPHLQGKTFGLAPEQADVADPFGGPVEVYEACAKKIDAYLDHWLDKLDIDTLPIWSV